MADDELSYDEIIAIWEQASKENTDRRKRRDTLVKMPVILSLLSWVLIIAEWFILDQAAPPVYYGWLSLFGYYAPEVSEPWNSFLVNVAYILLLASICLCVIAFVCNKVRMKRKSDKYSIAVFIISGVTVINFIIFLFQFVPMGILGKF